MPPTEPDAGRRVLFVMNTPLVGGAERHTFDLAAALRDRGWSPAIFAMKAGSLPPPEGITLLQPAAPCGLLHRIRDLAAVIKELAPHVVVAVNERPVLACWAARILARSRVPVAAISHSTVLRNRKEEWLQHLYTPLFNRLETVVFISRNQQRFWHARGLTPRRECVILNGIDTQRFNLADRAALRAQTRARHGLAENDYVIGLCAVMRPEKNHLQIVEAIARLRAEGLPARALLVGDGPMRGAVEARARALGIADHVIFAGMQADVRPYLAAFDVGALCSISIETLSLAALEAMAMGVPMVMSDLGGASEIVDDSCGRIFPVGDLDAFLACLRIYSSVELRTSAGLAARKRVEAEFNVNEMNYSYSRILSFIASPLSGSA